jgi:membrane glycosyltransferase
MHYWQFLIQPGLKLITRYQLAFALLMFVGSPAWIGLLVLGTLMVAAAPSPSAVMRADYGVALFAIVLFMWFAPKIATVVDVLTRPEARRAFGGAGRFLASVLCETAFFILLSPIMWLGHTLFIAGLMVGRAVGWKGQARDDHGVPALLAWRQLWPQSVIGFLSVLALLVTQPSALPYQLFISAGLLLAVPLAVATATPRMGALRLRWGLGRLPEETSPPPPLRALRLPAVEAASEPAAAVVRESSHA